MDLDLTSMIENSIKDDSVEETIVDENIADNEMVDMISPNPDIDHMKMINEDETYSNDEQQDASSDVDSYIANVVDFKKNISDNINNLQFTKCLTITSDDISNEDGIVILKSTEDSKSIIQLYKNMNNYNVFDHEVDYMKLCGENGFMIKYKSIDNYHWKLYGTKSSICVTMFIEVDENQYPIYHRKFTKTKFDKVELPENFYLMSVDEYREKLEDDSNFDIESCCIYYPPLYKKMDELITKKIVMQKLHDILVKTYDIAHCIKIFNAMTYIINM